MIRMKKKSRVKNGFHLNFCFHRILLLKNDLSPPKLQVTFESLINHVHQLWNWKCISGNVSLLLTNDHSEGWKKWIVVGFSDLKRQLDLSKDIMDSRNTVRHWWVYSFSRIDTK